ncbi:TetR/AcrR family transcriptional regulator [Pseudophaeobacter arcticus]|jgi:AcrR family transcriptional regulator|uniref:TetR/AcrR family transcriptional regulator n=1 Tax=Pseudophaeobacter arcticus TaxID=385492 RepID=UPI0039E5D7F1
MSGNNATVNQQETPKAPKELRKKGYHHKDLRNALLETALVLIDQRDGPHFSLRELERALGVSHASAYRHFADKAALLDALTAEGFGRLAACQGEELKKAGGDPMDRLKALGVAYIRFALNNKGFFSLMFSERGDENPERSNRIQHNQQALETLLGCIIACQTAGLIADGDPKRIAGYVILATHGLAAYRTQGHDPLGSGSDDTFFPGIDAVNELTIAPLLLDRPSASEMSRRWFAPLDPALRTSAEPQPES